MNGRRQRGQVLIALLLGSLLFGSAAGVLLLTGRTADALRKDIKHLDIVDSARRARLLDAVDRWQDANEAQLKSLDLLGDDTVVLMQRHDARAADFDTLMRRGDALNATVRDTLLDLRFALRHDLDAAQWQTLFGAQAAGR